MGKVWIWLDGKKTVLAGAYWGIVIPALMIIYPEGTPEIVDKITAIFGLVLTYLGLGHKVYKASGASLIDK